MPPKKHSVLDNSSKYFLVVKRGCVDQDIKVNGNENDGEGCEEILSHSALSRTHTRILCMCQKDLCNDATRKYPAISLFTYFLLFNVFFHLNSAAKSFNECIYIFLIH